MTIGISKNKLSFFITANWHITLYKHLQIHKKKNFRGFSISLIHYFHFFPIPTTTSFSLPTQTSSHQLTIVLARPLTTSGLLHHKNFWLVFTLGETLKPGALPKYGTTSTLDMVMLGLGKDLGPSDLPYTFIRKPWRVWVVKISMAITNTICILQTFWSH